MQIKAYNYNLDFIKGVACIFVVFLHCEFPGIFGIAVQAISRWCVPFFFMVSGYYCYKETPTDLSQRKRKAKHIFKITVNASLFYILFAFLQFLIWGDVSLNFSSRDVIAFLIFNQMFIIVSQMWFLFALLYVYILYMFVGETEFYRRNSHIISLICLGLYVVLAQGLHIAGLHVPNFLYKNWLIEGMGFFSLGYAIHKYYKSVSISDSRLLLIFFLSTFLSLVERFLLGRDFGVNICSIPQVLALFFYGIKNSNMHKGILQELGKCCSMFVYILHPFVWHSLERVYKALNISDDILALYLMPVIVLALTILFSIVCYKIQSKINTQKVIHA